MDRSFLYNLIDQCLTVPIPYGEQHIDYPCWGKENKRKYADLPAQVTLDLLHVWTDVNLRASGA